MNIEPTYAEMIRDFIAEYDPKLAAMFWSQPFNRVSIVHAFAKGLKPSEGCHDYEMGQTLINMAELDREMRAERNMAFAA